MKFLIQRFQLVYPSGRRDTVNLKTPVLVSDTEAFIRRKLKRYPHAVGVNLTFIEYEDDDSTDL